MIRTEKLTKEFGKTIAVDGLDLEVKEGEVFGFLGPNGAGINYDRTIVNMLDCTDQRASNCKWVKGWTTGQIDPAYGGDLNRNSWYVRKPQR